MKGDQQAIGRPHPATTPGRERRRFIQRRAQAITRAKNRLVAYACVLRTQFELTHFIDQVFTQLGGRRMRAGIANLRNQHQQRIGRGNQRI